MFFSSLHTVPHRSSLFGWNRARGGEKIHTVFFTIGHMYFYYYYCYCCWYTIHIPSFLRIYQILAFTRTLLLAACLFASCRRRHRHRHRHHHLFVFRIFIRTFRLCFLCADVVTLSMCVHVLRFYNTPNVDGNTTKKHHMHTHTHTYHTQAVTTTTLPIQTKKYAAFILVC